MIIEYKNPLLLGSICSIHDGFISSMDLICKLLALNNCKLYITSSDRCSTNVQGAIVTPAQMSNHLVGHAIDCNIYDASGKLWNSKALEVFAPESPNYDSTISNEILDFIKAVRQSGILRWGGDFHEFDTVHFDDGLNISNPARWKQIYAELFP